MGNLKIAYCDDDKEIVNVLDRMIKNFTKLFEIKMESDYYANGDAIIKSIKSGEYYDIIYMDIEMPGKNGIETSALYGGMPQ